jgi:hypothetical protein
VKIQVTEEDIKNGVREHCAKCPIALAAQRAGCQYPIVGTHLTFMLGAKNYSTDLPYYAHEFIGLFDTGQVVAPFEFDLELE